MHFIFDEGQVFTARNSKSVFIAINNLPFNKHTITYFKCNKFFKLSDQYNLQAQTYIFQLLHFNIDEEIEANLLVENQFHSHHTRSNN